MNLSDLGIFGGAAGTVLLIWIIYKLLDIYVFSKTSEAPVTSQPTTPIPFPCAFDAGQRVILEHVSERVSSACSTLQSVDERTERTHQNVHRIADSVQEMAITVRLLHEQVEKSADKQVEREERLAKVSAKLEGIIARLDERAAA